MSAGRAAAAAVLLLVLGHGASAADLLIEHATLISPERPAALPDAQVLIHAGRIAAVGTRLALPARAASTRAVSPSPPASSTATCTWATSRA